MVAARVAVTVAIALVQMAIFMGLGAAAFGLQLTGAWPVAVPLLVVGTLCFMAIGLAGAVAKTTEGAVNMANFLVLPMAFLSGSFFPLDAAPEWLQTVSRLLPLFWLNEGMLDVMVRGEPWSTALLPMAILAVFAIVVTALAAKLFRWETACLDPPRGEPGRRPRPASTRRRVRPAWDAGSAPTGRPAATGCGPD